MTPDPLSTIKAAIAQAQKLRAEATPGPWFTYRSEHAGWTVQIAKGWLIQASDKCGEGDPAFIAHARNVDFPAALEIAVKALEKATENAPTFRDYSGTDDHTCAWCREPVELPHHRHLAGCQWLGLRHALVEMARALAPEVKP